MPRSPPTSDETLDSNLQGNIIDLCPVGALVSKPYAFTARPWELSKTESIDVMDALGSNIRVDTKGREVMRFLPRNHDGVNEEWISDKTRFVWDGLRRQRLDKPYVRENGKLRPATWPEALTKAAEAMQGKKVAGLIGDLVPVEAAYALKGLVSRRWADRWNAAPMAPSCPPETGRAMSALQPSRSSTRAQSVMLIGANPAVEAPVLNARIRKAWTHGANVAVIGEAADLTYDYEHLGTGPDMLTEMLERDHDGVADLESIIIIGQGALCREDGAAVLAEAMKLAELTGSKFMVLHTAAGRVGAMDVGAVTEGGMTAALDGAEVIYNLGADEVDIRRRSLRDLSGQPWRPWRASCGRDPAGRRLYRGAGAVRQHRGPPAACAALPDSRRARPRRTGRSCARSAPRSGRSCHSIRWRSCARR